MIIFKEAKSLINFIQGKKKKGIKIHFVPTMGALHQGHISLINNAKQTNSITVCSIFINPTQFNKLSDFEKYPVTLENDIYQLEKLSCEVVFIPSASEIYPKGLISSQKYELGNLENIMEGKYRPGHFQGVCQVVHRLLEIVQPDQLLLGQKDYQQVMIIKKMVKLLGINVEIIVCPTLRENDRLAMSSRNMRLSKEERNRAATIFSVLSMIKNEIDTKDPVLLKENAIQILIAEGFKVDYVEIADADTLEIISEMKNKIRLVTLAAAYLNDVRLIDNLLISE